MVLNFLKSGFRLIAFSFFFYPQKELKNTFPIRCTFKNIHSYFKSILDLFIYLSTTLMLDTIESYALIRVGLLTKAYDRDVSRSLWK